MALVVEDGGFEGDFLGVKMVKLRVWTMESGGMFSLFDEVSLALNFDSNSFFLGKFNFLIVDSKFPSLVISFGLMSVDRKLDCIEE